MSHFLHSFLATALLLSCNCATALDYPFGDSRNCACVQGDSAGITHAEVLPGLGFDNLRNVDLGQVLAYNYSTCKVSGDSSYLMPDSVQLVPVQESKVDTFAEYFGTFLDYTSHTAASINFQTKFNSLFSSASGSYSADFQSTKSIMTKHDSSCARVSIRYKAYTALIASDAQLHQAFKSRLLDIAANIQNNNTKLAHYLAETLIRDYGTHVITSIDAGAGLSQTTFVSQDFLQQNDAENRSLTISKCAGAGFLFFLHSSQSQHTSQKLYSQFKELFSDSTTSSHIFTYGGPMYRVGNFSLTDWENGVADHLVAIDRSGVPLYSVITTSNVPELPDSTLLSVMKYVYEAVTRYYKVNTIPGCTNSSNPNFNFQANVDDGSCEEEKTPHFFGGMYQTCTPRIFLESIFCDDFKQPNPVTQDYTCSPGYEPILLHTNEGSKYESVRVCKTHCAFLGMFCHDNCWTYQKLYLLTYHAYWCVPSAASSSADTGLMFGGVYTLSQKNPVTGSRTCPQLFYSLRYGEDIHVCVSDDPQEANFSVPFGGFHSCSSGNPLVATKSQLRKNIYPDRCGKYYHQFLLTIDDGCEIYFCADVSAITKQQPHPPKLPPYHAIPRMSHNVTNTLIVKGTNGRVWIKNDDGAWVRYKDGQQTSQEYLMSLAQEAAGPPPSDDDNDTDINGGSIEIMVGVVVGSVASTVLVGGLIALLVFGIRKARSASKSKRLLQSGNNSSSTAYLVINDESDTTAHRNNHGATDSAV